MSHVPCSYTFLYLPSWYHTPHVISHPSTHWRVKYPPPSTQLKVLWPSSTLSAVYQFSSLPPPHPLYPCRLPWTVILRRHDIDRHINQRLSVALPPMPSRRKLAELQFFSNNGAESHTPLSSFLIIGRNHLPSALPWCLDLSRLIKLLPPFFLSFFFLEWKPILGKKSAWSHKSLLSWNAVYL